MHQGSLVRVISELIGSYNEWLVCSTVQCYLYLVTHHRRFTQDYHIWSHNCCVVLSLLVWIIPSPIYTPHPHTQTHTTHLHLPIFTSTTHTLTLAPPPLTFPFSPPPLTFPFSPPPLTPSHSHLHHSSSHSHLHSHLHHSHLPILTTLTPSHSHTTYQRHYLPSPPHTSSHTHITHTPPLHWNSLITDEIEVWYQFLHASIKVKIFDVILFTTIVDYRDIINLCVCVCVCVCVWRMCVCVWVGVWEERGTRITWQLHGMYFTRHGNISTSHSPTSMSNIFFMSLANYSIML